MPEPRVSIIIPTYCPTREVAMHFARCLKALAQFTNPETYQLIVVEQGTPYLRGFVHGLAVGPLTYEYFAEPVGFAKAVNIGLRLAETEYACILSNDVFVSPGWLETLIAEFESVPNMGILAPMDDAHLPNCQCPLCRYEGPATIFAGWHWGACMLMKREPPKAWSAEVGKNIVAGGGGIPRLFDETLNWRYCDQDLSIRMTLHANLLVARTSKVTVHHVSEATWGLLYRGAECRALAESEKSEMIRRYGVSTYMEVTGGKVTPMVANEKRLEIGTRPLFSICHTSARPDKWRAIYDAWIKAAVHPEQVEYVLCVDERWGFRSEAAMALKPVSLVLQEWLVQRSGNVLVWNDGRRCYVDGVNTAAKASMGRILIVNADDQWPCERWDERLKAQIQKGVPEAMEWEAAYNREYVIEISTGTPDEHNRGIMVMPILSRARYERLGYVFYPEYESMYADNDFFEHARQDGVVINSRLLMCPHKHPLFDASARKPGVPWQETDEAYQAQNRPEAYQSGLEILKARRDAHFNNLSSPKPVVSGQERKRVIGLCVSGERFEGEWLDGFLNLYDHLVNLDFAIYRYRGYTSNVYVTRTEILELMMSADPKPDLLLWLDDDNIVTPAQFDRLLVDLDQHPEADGITAWCWIYDSKASHFNVSCGTWAPDGSHWRPFDPRTFPKEYDLRQIEVTGFPCFLMRYRVAEQIGQRPFLPILDPRLTHGIMGEDFSFCKAANTAGLTFLVDPRVRVAHLKYYDTLPEFLNGVGPEEPKIAVMMRVKNEARWIERAIRSVESLGPVYIMDDGSDDGTFRIATEAGARVYTSPFIGADLDERRDKNWLLDLVVEREKPEWILCIDGDEELEPRGPEKIRLAIRNAEVDCFALKFCHLWDRPDQIRVDRWYSTFCRLSLFRPGPTLRFRSLYEYLGTNVHSGLHTGNAPLGDGRLENVQQLNVYLLHYGSMLRETRLQKYEYYNRIDPENEIEDRYRHIVQGDIPEVPKDAVLKYAGPLELKLLPESMLRRPLIDVSADRAGQTMEAINSG